MGLYMVQGKTKHISSNNKVVRTAQYFILFSNAKLCTGVMGFQGLVKQVINKGDRAEPMEKNKVEKLDEMLQDFSKHPL